MDSRSAQKRGYSFQSLVSELLRNNGFNVYPNARTANPRQTDLVAKHDNQYFLIETKWKNDPLGSNDVDDLRTRLNRNHFDVIGCLFSMSDFSKPAVAEVIRDRTREILLFNSREIYGLFSNRVSFSALVEKKRNELRTQARVVFEAAEYERDTKGIESIPAPSIFVGQQNNTTPWVTKSADLVEVVFAHDMAYVENIEGGDCVGFRMRLDVAGIGELQYALALACQHFGVSENGSYSIHQRPYAWHGFGLKSFLQAVGSWRERYAAARLSSFHHSEELAFFHQLAPGMFCLNARQRLSDNSFIHSAEVEIYLPGIPVDTQPFKAFCRDLNLSSGYFESVPESRAETETIRFYKRIPLRVVSLVISDRYEGQSISGAVVKNPFYRKPSMIQKTKSRAMRYITQEELIFCALRDWLPVSAKPGTLVLTDLEATMVGQSPVLRPVCTWETFTESEPEAEEATRRKKFLVETRRILKSAEIADRFTGKKKR